MSRGITKLADRTEHDQAENDRAWPAGWLFRELKAAWSVDSLEQLARTANANGDFAGLFPAVLAAAEAGDAVARQVIAQASRELAQLAAIVLRRLFSGQHSSALSAVPMAMAGGVFRHAAMIRELFYNEVHAANPDVVLNPEVVDPVHGALQMARRAACERCDPSWIRTKFNRSMYCRPGAGGSEIAQSGASLEPDVANAGSSPGPDSTLR